MNATTTKHPSIMTAEKREAVADVFDACVTKASAAQTEREGAQAALRAATTAVEAAKRCGDYRALNSALDHAASARAAVKKALLEVQAAEQRLSAAANAEGHAKHMDRELAMVEARRGT